MATPATSPTPESLVERLLEELKLKADNLQLTDDELGPLGVFDYATREEWIQLRQAANRDLEERNIQLTKRLVQEAVRENIIESWLAQNASLADEYGRDRLVRAIDEDYRAADRVNELTQYLTDVLKNGVKQADANRKKHQRVGGYAGHAWAVITGLGRLGLVVGIFAAAESKFQTIVFALLVVIYNGLDAAYRADRHFSMVMAFGIDSQFSRVMRRLGYDEQDWEREARLGTEQEARLEGQRSVVRFYISSSLIGLTWLYAMFKLVVAVFF